MIMAFQGTVYAMQTTLSKDQQFISTQDELTLAEELQTVGAWDHDDVPLHLADQIRIECREQSLASQINDISKDDVFTRQLDNLLKNAKKVTKRKTKKSQMQSLEDVNPYAPDLSCGELLASCVCGGIVVAYHYIMGTRFADDLATHKKLG
jgi:hypothetical protein